MSRIGLEKNATDLSFAVKEFVNTKQGLGKTPMLSYPTLQKIIP